jgi:serine/threonine protein kinase
MDRSGRKPGVDAMGATVSTGGLEKNLGASPDLVLGAMVGEYRIDGILGEGGMGKVYSATHPVIAKRAAIKVLHPELSMNKEAVDRFVQEARSVNQIGHPNIVDIFSFGTMSDGRCYFVMEQLRGESLRTRLRRPPALSLADALSILDTITVALDAAHEKGIVHRDLKPDNVFLVEVKADRPQVKLLDFGIAKLLGNDGRVAEKTRTGNLLGTPAYMSPEQARGYAVDHRTDVYALGAMAFELATGRLPFPFDNAADMIAAHLFQPPPSARTFNGNVSPQLDALIQRLLAKEPAHRPTLAQARDEIRTCRGQLAYHVLAGQHVDAQGAPTDPQVGYPTPIGHATPGYGTPAGYPTPATQGQTQDQRPTAPHAGTPYSGQQPTPYPAYPGAQPTPQSYPGAQPTPQSYAGAQPTPQS